MSFEKYFNYYKDADITVRKGQSAEFEIDGKDLDLSKEHKLFVTGDTNLFYQFKTEPGCVKIYHSIDDTLDDENANKSQYCLNLSSNKPDGLIKRIYKHINWPPKLSYLPMMPLPEEFQFGISIKTDNLKFEKDGYCRIALDVKYKNQNIDFYDTTPDERTVIEFTEGSNDWKYIGKNVNINADKCDFCGYWIECYNYTGNLYIESPILSGNGKNLLPEFTTPVSVSDDCIWSAQNISKKEWPMFRIDVNGKEVFCGEVFERCHVGGEWSIVIPENTLICGNNLIKITHISQYKDVLPYTFHEISLIERSADDFEIIAVTPCGAVNGTLPVLIKTRQDNLTARFICNTGHLYGEKEYFFENKGLHGIKLNVNSTGKDVEFYFECQGKKIKGMCPLLCIKENDDVFVGSGDMIYIHQDKESFEEFICWYFSNNIGNLLTIRPTYRWSGTRTFDGNLWRDFARVLNELGIKYSLMVDGRELPGMDCNAPYDIISGDGFLGRQMHERDGAAYYWLPQEITNSVELQFIDMGERIFRERKEYSHTERAAACFIYKDGRIFRYRQRDLPEDYKFGHDYSVKRLSDMRFDATRHTGPTVMFNSFIEAGYSKIGAETLYSSTEPLCSFMRGIERCTSQSFTVHHALQWYATPHDSRDHAERYRLANYISYIQGAGEINTEEGLWRIEQAFNKYHRFTPCLTNLKNVNEKFYKYLLSHSRKGKFHSNVAFISGKYDGWVNFGGGRIWGLYDTLNGEPENSWDKCLKLFYPKSKLSDFLSGKYLDNVDTSIGFFTGTPLGNPDVIPSEADKDVLEKYPFLCFAGYNYAEKELFDKLYSLCENGCHLLISRAHFATQTDIVKVRQHDLNLLNHQLAFLDGDCVFEEKTYNGKSVNVCTNFKDGFETLAACDDGTPLLIKYKVGKGYITILNANVYPSHDAISDLYVSYIQKCTEQLNKQEKVFVKCKDNVQFTVYDDNDERHIYLIATDWYNKNESLRNAVIYDSAYEYNIEIPYGVLIKAVAKDDIIIYPLSENGEVLEINENNAVLQGSGNVTFIVCRHGVQKALTVNFDKVIIKEISI